MLSQVALNETWQNGLDPVAWAWVNPATGVWAVANLYATATLAATETARLRSLAVWDARPGAMSAAHVIQKLHAKWEVQVDDDTNIDQANSFMGMTNGAADTGATNNIIGFRYITVGPDIILQAVSDNAGVETTVNITGIDNTILHKLEMIIMDNEVEFYVDEVHRATITTNLADSVRYFNLYWAMGGGGGATPVVGYVNVYPEIN